ncbi:MAG: hypothetical protein GVY16_07705 [Planctomycetes bacterium]|nr:hypothetical protein [Phycisphaerae bacterium]NBB95611.1 hypothetical protein [Planctomycetota bacterium]
MIYTTVTAALAVVVAQVVEPTPQAPLTGRPAMGSVFLVDRHDTTVATGTTTHLSRVVPEADRLHASGRRTATATAAVI